MRFKKYLLAGLLIMSVLSLSAQEQKQCKDEFLPHWYMQIQAGAAHTRGEVDFSKLISPAGALNFGYQFTPVFDLRFGVAGWQGKGALVGPTREYDFNFFQVNADAVANFSNWFGGFKPKRTFSFYGFLGVGFNHAFNNGAVDIVYYSYYASSNSSAPRSQFDNLWEDNTNSLVGRAGLGANIRLSNTVDFNIEVNSNALSDKFNSKKADNLDWQFNALAGLKIRLGKSYRHVHGTGHSSYSTPAPVEKPAEKPVEKEVVKQEEPAPVMEKKAETHRCDVFFILNSSVVRTAEAAKVNAMAAFMKHNPEVKVTLTGYADAQTGNDKINTRLSEERAAAVKDILVKAGIDASRISTDFKGSKEQPFADNDMNRVTICVAK